MRIYIITDIGNAEASSPRNNGSVNYRVLSYIRRHHGQSSDEQLKDQLQLDGTTLRRVMDDLERSQAVRCVVSN